MATAGANDRLDPLRAAWQRLDPVRRAFWRSFFRLLIFTAALAEWICIAWVLVVMLDIHLPWPVHFLGPVALHTINRAALGGRRASALRRTPLLRIYIGVVFTCLFGMVALLLNGLLWGVVAVAFEAASQLGAGVTATDVLGPAGLTGSVALVTVSTLIAWGYGPGQRFLRLVELDVPVANLGAAFDGYRIAQISDVHLGGYMDEALLARHVDRVNALDADLVVITGDITDGLDHAPRTFPILGRLRGRDGVVAILGNHDVYTGADEVTAALRRLTPIRVLRDQGFAIERGDSRLHVLGVNDAGADWTRGVREHPALPPLVRSLPPGEPVLLLSHRPDLFGQAASYGIALTLSGHTHGGQIAVPWPSQRPSSLAHFISDYPRGTYRVGNSTLHVNLGLGVTGQPVRLFSPREITLVSLRTKNSQGE
jgi:predicted MPP superfamily phosphohydrolase